MAYNPSTPKSSGGDDLPAITQEVRPPRLRKPPFMLIAAGLIATVATWIPLVLAARARVTRSELPRIHLVQDMGTQPKYREQQTSDVFADGRADRPVIEGTVAYHQVHDDEAYENGFTTGADGKPSFVTMAQLNEKQRATLVEEKTLLRGQERFNIYCSVCHGRDGYGNGAVAQRAMEIGNAINPANLHDAKFRDRADGHIFNTINVGIRNMPSYGAQISVEDRWAIVAYVRALQYSQNAPPSAVPEALRATLSVPPPEKK